MYTHNLLSTVVHVVHVGCVYIQDLAVLSSKFNCHMYDFTHNTMFIDGILGSFVSCFICHGLLLCSVVCVHS